MNKRICIISFRYPTDDNPVYTFVEQLVSEIVDQGYECTVISPVSVTDKILKNRILPKRKEIYKTKNNNNYEVYFPKYVSFGSFNIGSINSLHITTNLFYSSIEKLIDKEKLDFDIYYGHFIVPSGITASRLALKYNKKAYLAYGESTTSLYERYGIKSLKKELNAISKVVAVSTLGKKQLLESTLFNNEQISVIPNAINNNIFFVKDKFEMRKKYGFEKDSFIVAFVGSFIERKGPLRLASALDLIDDVQSIFIGSGTQVPNCKNTCFVGKVKHNEMSDMLNVADVFVLPTNNEGCCNAIIEAMACGLPIISSNQEFNDDILDETCSIRINPMDIDAIKKSIEQLKNDESLRSSLRNGAIQKAKSLELVSRAKKILSIINEE